MERKKKRESGGFYIAVCCLVVVIAIIGYANSLPEKESIPDEKVAQNVKIPEREETMELHSPEPEKLKADEVKKEVEESAQVNKNVEVEDVKFNPPVDGRVIEEYSGDDLVYNEALKDWRAHSGVDFEAKIGEQVVCSARGVVEDVFDSELGRCVVIDHKNGFKTMYANLDEETLVKKGDEVSGGDVIGIVGNTALGDSTDEPHLHFEMMKEEKNVNPTEFL